MSPPHVRPHSVLHSPRYLDAEVGNLPIVKAPNWGVHGADKHAFYPANTAITPRDEKAIQSESAKRLRSMLSVDDMVRDIREYLVSRGEWNNTWIFFSSDHGCVCVCVCVCVSPDLCAVTSCLSPAEGLAGRWDALPVNKI